MIKIEKKICLEPFIDRSYPPLQRGVNASQVDKDGCPIPPINKEIQPFLENNPSWGEVIKPTITFPIQITETVDNLGLYTDIEYTQSENITSEGANPYTRDSRISLEGYITSDEYTASGYTESKLEAVRTYNQTTPYKVGQNVSKTPSKSFDGVLEITEEYIKYVLGGQIDSLGIYINGTGVVYKTFNTTREVIDPLTGDIIQTNRTSFEYTIKGIKENNYSLSALIKESKYLGVSYTPSVDDDILVDRGEISVFERHLKMAEIRTIDGLVEYDFGFFNVTSV